MPENSAPQSIVLYANIDPDVSDAGSLHVAGLADGFAAAGHNVQLVIPRPRADSEMLKMLGAGVELYSFRRPHLPGYRTVWSLGTVLAIPTVLRLLLRRPRFLYVRDDQSTWLLHGLARLLRIPSAGEHNSLIGLDRGPRGVGRMKGRLLDLGQRLGSRLASRSRAVTEGIKLQLVARGADAGRIFVVGNGTDMVGTAVPPRAECLRRLNLPQDRIYVGFIGHLVWWQGCDQLLEAFARAHQRDRRLSLLFAGQGPMTAALREAAAQRSLDADVHFLGSVAYERRAAVIGAFDIACFTGTAARNLEQGVSPLKIRDYAACGRAILAARLPGLEEMAAQRALVLYEADDIADLEEQLVRLAAGESVRRDLGVSARRYAEENFSWSVAAGAIIAGMNQLASGSRPNKR